ncbi:MAG: proton-conducting transporter membrane subunit [Anaerolineae bacterium]
MSGNIQVILPLASLTGGAFILYLIARLVTGRNELLAFFTALVFAVALGTLLPLFAMTGPEQASAPTWGYLESGGALTGAFLRPDPGGLIVAGVALGLGILVALYSGRYLALDHRYRLYYPLLLLLVAGSMGMLMAADLFNLYMFCELMSVAAYVLVAFRRRTDTSIEAGFKYLIMGSVGTVIMLLGISFIYRETGTLALPAPSSTGGTLGTWTRAGLACLLVGLSVKSAIVPLHTWLPDAQNRAPSSIAAMLSGVIDQSALYVLIKIALGLGWSGYRLGTWLILFSFLNMTLGNLLALVQTYTKRLLGYSTIAQIGYIMLSMGVGLRYQSREAIQAALFLLIAHAAMKGLAFLSKGVCHFYCGTSTVYELRGTAVQAPLVAATFSIALAGLAGVPPLAGFASKWFVVGGILQAADTFSYVVLTVFLLNSLIALGYYLPLIGTLFMRETSRDLPRIRVSPWMTVPLVIMGAMVLAIGLYPEMLLGWTTDVAPYLLMLGG